jgi:hypothetical protein
MDQSWRCACCGQLIGVYEPLLVVDDDGARTTSRAAEPGLDCEQGVPHYHAACHDDPADASANQAAA